MEIGLVIHGPEIVDSGQAKKIIEILSAKGTVTSMIAGTMGKTAVIDAHLENTININRNLKPSECIEECIDTDDVIYLLNHGKNLETGIAFAGMVISHLKRKDEKPIVHIERPGSPDGAVIPWNELAQKYANTIANELGLSIILASEQEKEILLESEGERVVRHLTGVQPGEKILVNGIVVGSATSFEVSIITENGYITQIKGGTLKEHGVEKLHNYEHLVPIDLKSAWVKSGRLRSDNFKARTLKTCELSALANKENRINRRGIRAVIVDHAAEKVFDIVPGADIAVTVGDDTTILAADILYRLGIPIIGITDGDSDGVSHRTHIFPGSTILRLIPDSDDVIGRKILANVFMNKKNMNFASLDELKAMIIQQANDAIKYIKEY
ncbi:DUF2117 domain-containing protein [uncultured Methanomethylovorans sp.]|uniref:DUF2117 family protein n=1 Tax=uncultured Methanomethylovorans sp. TaxID=183759 RepID=UPI002AA76B70|nr:DUF2117 domain-containing protein [uncultured Methanomethylovorans sp.]